MMRKILVIVLFAAGIALADDSACFDLCESCQEGSEGGATCAKIESVCSCAELFEEVEAEAAGKEARTAIRGQALKNLLYEECLSGRCVSKIWFEGTELKNFQAEESTDFDIKAVPEPELTPLQDKCAELCGMLDASEGSRLETACGCQAHVQDSLKLVQFRLARLEGVQTAAAEIAEFCAEKEACKVQVALNGTTFEVARLEFPQAKQPDPNELALAAFKAKRRAAIGNSLYTNCELGRCQIQLKFDGESGKLQAVKPEGLAPVPEPKVKPLGTECAELCRDLSGEEETPMSQKIEASCGCRAHVRDSIKLEAFRAGRIANSDAAADSVVEFCSAKRLCNVELLLDGASFELKAMKEFEAPPPPKPEPKPKYDRQEVVLETILSECKGAKANTTCDIRFTFQGTLLSFKKADNPAPAQGAPVNPDQLRKPNAVQAAKAVNDFCSAEKACDVDVSLRGKTLGLISLSPHKGDFPYKEGAYREEGPNGESGKNGNEVKNSYGGFMLYSGSGSWSYSKDYFDWVSSGGVEAGLGFLLRWYFYRWGSFQMGFNANYSYIDLGSDSYYVSRALGTIEYDLLYHNVSVEVPLQLRLGVPFIYGTFQFTMRKQVWSLLVIDDGDETEYSYSTLSMDDWRFLGHAGLGFELSRHFLVDVLFVLFDLGTAGDYVEQDEGFRIQLNFAW